MRNEGGREMTMRQLAHICTRAAWVMTNCKNKCDDRFRETIKGTKVVTHSPKYIGSNII